MAYNTNAPQGLKPVRYMDGSPYTGKANRYRIASGYATAIGQWDPIVQLADGTVGIGVAGAACSGVLEYVEYFTTGGAYIKAPNWVASTTAKTGTTVYAFVHDDPTILFDVQETNGAGVSGTPIALADVGSNINFVIGAPSALGISTTSLNNTTTATTSTLNLKIMALSDYPGNAVGAFANWFVTWNSHTLKSVGTTGV